MPLAGELTMIRAILLWLLALAALMACSPGLSAGVAALGAGVGDAARMIGAGVAVALVAVAVALVWAFKPQPARPPLLYSVEWPRETIEPGPMLLDERQAVNTTWREI